MSFDYVRKHHRGPSTSRRAETYIKASRIEDPRNLLVQFECFVTNHIELGD